MEDSDVGCGSVFSALGIIAIAFVLGGSLGLPLGTWGGIAGSMLLPTALGAGTLAWGAISLPWVIIRIFAPTLPEWSVPRALVAYLGVTPAVAALGAFSLAGTMGVEPIWVAGMTSVFGLAGAVLAIPTALFARHGMLFFIGFFVEAAA